MQGLGAVDWLRPPRPPLFLWLPPCPSRLTEMSPPQRALPDQPPLKWLLTARRPALSSCLVFCLACSSFASAPTWQTRHYNEKQVVSLGGEPKPSPKPVRPPHSPTSPLQPLGFLAASSPHSPGTMQPTRLCPAAASDQNVLLSRSYSCSFTHLHGLREAFLHLYLSSRTFSVQES